MAMPANIDLEQDFQPSASNTAAAPTTPAAASENTRPRRQSNRSRQAASTSGARGGRPTRESPLLLLRRGERAESTSGDSQSEISSGGAPAGTLPPRRPHSPEDDERRDGNGQTINEAMTDCFGNEHRHARVFNQVANFLNSDFGVERAANGVMTVHHAGERWRFTRDAYFHVQGEQLAARSDLAAYQRSWLGEGIPAGRWEGGLRAGLPRHAFNTYIGGNGMLTAPGGFAEEEGVDWEAGRSEEDSEGPLPPAGGERMEGLEEDGAVLGGGEGDGAAGGGDGEDRSESDSEDLPLAA